MTTNLTHTVDEYGRLDAEIKALLARKDELRDVLIDSGYEVAAGDEYALQVSTCDRTTVDWKAVAAKLEPSHQLVAAHSKTAAVTTVKVTDRRLLNATKLNRKLKLAA